MSFMLGKVRVSVDFALTALLMVYALLGGGRMLALSIAASAMHELGHLAALRARGGVPDSISLTARGALICTGRPPDLLFALGGAGANVLCAFVCAAFGAVDLCAANAALGLVSLLPVYPLDGAQALSLALERFAAGEKICRAISTVCSVALIFAGTLALLHSKGNFSLLFLALWLMAAIFDKALDSAPGQG